MKSRRPKRGTEASDGRSWWVKAKVVMRESVWAWRGPAGLLDAVAMVGYGSSGMTVPA